MSRFVSTCIIAVVLLCTSSALAADTIYAANHRSKLDKTKQLAITANGKALAEIVVADDAGKVAAYAAEEMQMLLQKVTGAKLPIVSKASGKLTAIHLGETTTTTNMGIDVAKLPRDAFVIKSSGRNIFIVGRDSKDRDPKRGMYVWGVQYERATLFGTYEFLEQFAGVRFFFPGEMGVVTPKQPSLSVPSMDIYEAPDFDMRGLRLGGSCQLPNGKKLIDDRWTWTHMNLRWRYSTHYIPCCHGLSRRGLLQRFGKTNPEYFALLPNGKRDNDPNIHGHRGHLDYLNEEFLNEVFLDAKSYLTGEPASVRGVMTNRGRIGWDPSSHQPGYFDLGPQDGLGERNWDRSPASWKYWTEGRQSDLMWGYTTKIAQRLKDEGIPGYVTNFAYSVFREVPSDDIKFPDNLLVQVCLRGPWDDVVPALKKKNDRIIKDWNKKTTCKTKVWLWNYMHSYHGHVPRGVPPVSTRLITNYYRRLAPELRGARSQGDNYWLLFNYLNNYTFYKVAWNTETNRDALMADHHKSLFGPAAKPMGAFFERIETIWETQGLGEVRETALGPIPVRKGEDEVWKKIYNEKVMGELKGYFTKAKNLAKKDKTALARVKFFEVNFLGEIANQRNAYFARIGDIDDLIHEVAPAKGKITVDGKLNEGAWKKAKPVYLAPYKGADPRVTTAVRSVWTEDTLYVAYECFEPRGKDMILDIKVNDDTNMWKDSGLEIFLNPSSDRKTYYHLIVNANGFLADSKIVRVGTKLSKDQIDLKWSSKATIITRILKDRWIAEIAVPARSLGALNIKATDSWVANFNRGRNISTKDMKDNQLLTWSPYLAGNFHDIHHFGSLKFVKKLTDPKAAAVQNGSFEKMGHVKPWVHQRGLTPENGGESVIDTTTYREGKQSLRISNKTLKRIVITQVNMGENSNYLKTGKRYRLSYWVKGENIQMLPTASPKFTGGFVNIWSHCNQFFPTPKQHTGTFGWMKQAFEFTAKPALKGAKPMKYDYIRLGLNGASGTIWFDDVRVEEID
jgi:Domain of unknown function (DUF4838)/Carbohydrate family 9 binding domain-like/Carbohydrate binding domain